MTMPNFLVIGTAKAGTTSLYQYLQQHPQVFLPEFKEPRFFAMEGKEADFQGPGDPRHSTDIVHSIADYEGLFEKAGTARAVGEMSTWYLYSRHAAPRIRTLSPGVRLIAILRDPAERAYSSFLSLVRDERESERTFAAALGMEERRIGDNWEPLWHYRAMGYYHEQLRRYFELFPRTQVLVILYEDFRDRPQKTFQRIFEFIGVEPSVVVDDSSRTNISSIPRSRALFHYLRSPSKLRSGLGRLLPESLRRKVIVGLHNANLHRPPLDPQVRADLVSGYREDILRLQDLIERDLSPWLR